MIIYKSFHCCFWLTGGGQITGTLQVKTHQPQNGATGRDPDPSETANPVSVLIINKISESTFWNHLNWVQHVCLSTFNMKTHPDPHTGTVSKDNSLPVCDKNDPAESSSHFSDFHSGNQFCAILNRKHLIWNGNVVISYHSDPSDLITTFSSQKTKLVFSVIKTLKLWKMI